MPAITLVLPPKDQLLETALTLVEDLRLAAGGREGAADVVKSSAVEVHPLAGVGDVPVRDVGGDREVRGALADHPLFLTPWSSRTRTKWAWPSSTRSGAASAAAPAGPTPT